MKAKTKDPACKRAVNWVTKTIRRITLKRALQRGKTKIENCEVTPQAIWPNAKSLTKRGEPKETTAIHGPLGPVFHPNEKANVIANYLENLITRHKVCDTNHESWVEALPKPCKNPKFSQTLRPVSLLSTTGKLFEVHKVQ
jgi:hypothetical protein